MNNIRVLTNNCINYLFTKSHYYYYDNFIIEIDNMFKLFGIVIKIKLLNNTFLCKRSNEEYNLSSRFIYYITNFNVKNKIDINAFSFSLYNVMHFEVFNYFNRRDI